MYKLKPNKLKVFQLHISIGLLQFAQLTLSFNLETKHPRIFATPDAGSHFGHRVCHFGPPKADSVLVTAPFLGNGTGGVYRCYYHSNQPCQPLPVEAVDPGIAFGLSLACSDDRAMVCGPRLSHECFDFNYLNGLCVELGPQFNESQRLKPAFQVCHDFSLDAVVLFDDSQSITNRDFKTMIKFIKKIISMFTDPRRHAQVAVAQYSTEVYAVFNFENFADDGDPDRLMKDVVQAQGQTYTPSAIRFVLKNMFSEEKGMKKDSRKLLVVITDGKSNDKESFDSVIRLAEKMAVTRFAIGVGKEYSRPELEQIASSPRHVFESVDFDALSSIQEQLQKKIFAIEGTDPANSSTFQLELSQGGFSVALSEDLSIFGAVGAFSGSGGFVEKAWGGNMSFINDTTMEEDLKDSYLGYSVAMVDVNGSTVCYAGAPRYRHTGLVLAFHRDPLRHTWTVTHRIHGSQLGSYFGAALCVLTHKVLLVGVPFYHANGVGGEVRACTLESGTPNCSQSLRGSVGNEFGQFGASLSPCPDLNGDGVPELLVGAPMEDQGRGSLYIFLGHPGGVRPKFSQKVGGAWVGSGLQHFGLSVHSAGDLSADGLTDLVVGGRGAAAILRSHPVMCVPVSVTLHPPIIPQDYFHCSAPLALNKPIAMVTVCVTLKEVVMGTTQAPLKATVSMSLELDTQTRGSRLLFQSKSGTSRWGVNLTSTSPLCHNLSLIIPECISDYHEVSLSGHLTIEGQEIPHTGGLRPMLNPDCPPSFTHMVLLEKVCGEDHVCVSDLHVSLNFTRPVVVSSPGFPVTLSVEVTNHGEDASGTELTLVHPSALSFTRTNWFSGDFWCVSNSTEVENHIRTVCQFRSTFFRHGVMTTVLISFTVSDSSSLTDRLAVNVSVASKNENDSTLQDNTASSSVPVKLPVNISVKDGSYTRYIIYPEDTLLEHTYEVENSGDVPVPVNVTFVLPVKMDSGFMWNVTLPKTDSSRGKCRELSNITTFSQHCGGELCRLIGCTVGLLSRDKPISFKFIGKVSRTTKVSGVLVKAESWGILSFDQLRYIQYPEDGIQQFSIVSELQSPSEALTVVIVVVSVLLGLVVLAIVFGVLYKTGFFKTRMERDGDGSFRRFQQSPTPPEDEPTAPPAGVDDSNSATTPLAGVDDSNSPSSGETSDTAAASGQAEPEIKETDL